MAVERFLQPVSEEALEVPIAFERRIELRWLLGEELYGESLGSRGGAYHMGSSFFDFANRTVSTGVLEDAGSKFGNDDWTVVDTAFGCRYLVLVDYKGGFILLALMQDVDDVFVRFDRPVELDDRPSRRYEEDRDDPIPTRRRQQYLAFLSIAAILVAESELRSRS